ncbi:MAG: methylmalonyl Co-A mutase-associated GTPase MeaB [Pseudomonadota bacterium]|nr:methylmalonyl Co-A mutase-associated GTPase MeaB [Pseudomonadota bacterium]
MSVASAKELAKKVREGDRRALAQAITKIESENPTDKETAKIILEELTPYSGNSFRLGVSGVPGVGKSTFIENLGNYLIGEGHKIAVLAVDPSSVISGGSILGDKTRMEKLSRKLEAFIRPSPAGATLGGVSRRTRETMLLTEAAGFDIVLIETVGVGQSETTVSQMTDMFLLMLLPGGGDELQGIKRGIVELADLILVNKSDGEMTLAAEQSVIDYRKAVSLMHPRTEEWNVKVESFSALSGAKTEAIWKLISEYKNIQNKIGAIEINRSKQARNWMWNEIGLDLTDRLKKSSLIKSKIIELESAVAKGKMSPTTAADGLVKAFLNADKN